MSGYRFAALPTRPLVFSQPKLIASMWSRVSILSASRISLADGEASHVQPSCSSSLIAMPRYLTESNESTKVQVDRPRYETRDKKRSRWREGENGGLEG